MLRVFLFELSILPLLAAVTLWLHSLRRQLGLVPLMVLMAGFALALQLLSPTAPYFLVDGRPVVLASVSMVPAVLLGLLLIYVIDGTASARLAIIAVLSGTVLGTAIMGIQAFFAGLPGVQNLAGLPSDSPALHPSLPALLGSTLALLCALYAMAIVYQAVSNLPGRDRIAGAAVLALAAGIAADSLVFHLVASTGNGTFLDWFYPDLAAKMAGGLMVWPFAWVYVTRSQQGPGRSDSRPTFDLLFGEQGRTERALHRAEAARVESEERYRRLVEQASDGIVVVDRDARLLDVNERVEDMLGLPADEIIGRGFEEFVAPESLAERPLRIPEILEGKTTLTRRELIRPEGGRVPVETSARLLPDGTILGILRDLTEREEAERRIRRSEAFYRTLLESAYEVTTLVDEDGMIRYQSPAIRRVLGYEPGDLAGVSAWSRVHPDDLPVAREAWDQALAEPGRPVDLEVRLMSASGEWRTVAASVTDRRDSSSISAIVVRYKDVTSERILREQLQQAQKLESIGILAGGVAHDFNNLLTAIIGHAEFARSATAEGETVAREIGEISAAAERAAALTQQLLAFARKQVSQPTTVDLRNVVRHLQVMLRRIIGEHVALHMDLGDEPLWVRIDTGQLEQVLVNLAVNARDAMPDGGNMRIETRKTRLGSNQRNDLPDDSYARLSVGDEGHGIPENALELVFEPFFTTKPAGKGTGLGLATCYGIVKQARGHIHIADTSRHGTTVEVLLPLADAPAETDAQTSMARPADPTG